MKLCPKAADIPFTEFKQKGVSAKIDSLKRALGDLINGLMPCTVLHFVGNPFHIFLSTPSISNDVGRQNNLILCPVWNSWISASVRSHESKRYK